MDLPFTLIVERPSRAELRALLRQLTAVKSLWLVAPTLGALAIAGLLVSQRGSDALATQVTAPLRVLSRPLGAAIWVDGQERGRTPATVSLAPGVHQVVLRARDAVDRRLEVRLDPTGTSIETRLWRPQPRITRLRPALPGAKLTDARLITGGRIALLMSSAVDREVQVWQLDPASGGLQLRATAPGAQRAAVSSDGEQVAYVGPGVGPSDPPDPASLVWLARPAPQAPVAIWRFPLPDEQLTDLSWSPDGRHLLVVSARELAGGMARSRVWSLPVDGSAARELAYIPSRVVTGAVAWSPDGQHVALVARAGETSALCVADLEGGFRYLADLAPADTSVPMVYPPVAWSPDSQRLAFVAPMQQPSSAPLGWLRTVSDAVYVLDITAVAAPELMAETDAAVPGWQEDGAILLLAHPHTDGPVVIRRLSPGGGVDDVLDVPLKLGPGFSAQWDRANAQLLIAASGAQSNEFWLIGLGLEGGA